MPIVLVLCARQAGCMFLRYYVHLHPHEPMVLMSTIVKLYANGRPPIGIVARLPGTYRGVVWLKTHIHTQRQQTGFQNPDQE